MTYKPQVLTVPEGGTGDVTLAIHGFLIGNGTSAVNTTLAPTDGQLPIGKTGSDPTMAVLSAGPGIAIANGAGTITISNIGAGFTWSDKAVSFAAVAENGYRTSAGAIVATLPNPNIDGASIMFQVDFAGAATLTVTAAGGDKIRLSSALSAANGTAANTAIGDTLHLVYRLADVTWIAQSFVGNWTIP